MDTPFTVESVPYIPTELRDIAERVAKGERPAATVRTLLHWFWHSKRRGRWIVSVIRTALDALNLKTEPDFNWTFLDDWVTFHPKASAPDGVAVSPEPAGAVADAGAPGVAIGPQPPESTGVTATDSEEQERAPLADPTYRIGRLEIAHRPPVSVAPDAPIEYAVHLMLKHNFSQLPVMTSDREIKGLVSWKSLASRWSQGLQCAFVREALEKHESISVNDSIFHAIRVLQEHECVLIRDATRKVCGILTPYDISHTFGQLAEPFLILGEIENHIRILMEGKFSQPELADARDSVDLERRVETVADLTLGECMRLIEKPEPWDRLGLRVDRALFIRDLDKVRRIRNDVMHFDPEGIDEADIKELRDFVAFLQRLRELKTND
jgi:CBS domain-containing protein